MGEDNLVQFQNWKNYEKILEFYEIYLYPRPNTPAHDFGNHPKVKFVEAPLLDISATYIRKRLQEQKNIKYLVTDQVEAYIELKKFYIWCLPNKYKPFIVKSISTKSNKEPISVKTEDKPPVPITFIGFPTSAFIFETIPNTILS